MILLTGATGNVGSALLRRLTDAGQPVYVTRRGRIVAKLFSVDETDLLPSWEA